MVNAQIVIKNNPREERTKALKEKDFTNAKSLLEWLVLAREAVEENSQSIINNKETDDIKKFREENDFIYKELNNLQFPGFFMERKEEAQKSNNDQEQEIINELQLVIEGKKDEIKEIKKVIEESNSGSKHAKKDSVLSLKSVLKNENKKKRDSKIINSNLSMNSNKKVIENLKKLLTSGKEELEKKTEAEVLLKQVEQALQADDNDLKAECEKLCNELDSDEYKKMNYGLLDKTWLKYYLDRWYIEEVNELTTEQKEKLENYDKLEKEKEELAQKIAELEQEKEVLEKKVENRSWKGTSVPPTPMTPVTPGFLKEEERQEVAVDEWLENNYGEDKEDVCEISADKSLRLTGELVIKDYGSLETISLEEMKITTLTIENCPKVEEIEVYGNELTEIIGLENLPELKGLACGSNQISRLDISKNTKLTKLLIFDNPNSQIVGLQNLSLTEFRGDSSNLINLIQITKEELEEAAKKLGIDEKELENKSSEEIKELIQKEGNIIKENETKLNDPKKGLPGLIKNRKVDDDELEKVKKDIAKVEELKKKLEETKEKTQREIVKAKAKEKEVLEKLKEEKQLAKVTEIRLKKQIGSETLEQFKIKVKRDLEVEKRRIEKEELKANIEVNDKN